MGIGTIEQWLWKAQKILHYNHAWILEMEFQLVVAYSRLIEDILCQSTADSAKHKLRPIRERVVQMTMHLLEVRKNQQNKTSFEKHCQHNTVGIPIPDKSNFGMALSSLLLLDRRSKICF